jgi:Ni,Fe-hydrogenase III large subunit
VLGTSEHLAGALDELLPVDLRIPGCPPHPGAIAAALLDDALDGPVAPVAASAGGRTHRLGVARVESPRGATTCTVALERGRIVRLRLRTGSYANWPAVAHAAAGNLLPDFPLVNKSFELCYACVDR